MKENFQSQLILNLLSSLVSSIKRSDDPHDNAFRDEAIGSLNIKHETYT